jgi:hypothetical protein
MGKAKKTRKFAVTKRMISPKDTRVRENLEKAQAKEAAIVKKETEPRQVEQGVSALFFQYNTQLGPPYHILVDTNFINFSIRKKLDMVRSMMDCLLAKCIPCITDWYDATLSLRRCVVGPCLTNAIDASLSSILCTVSWVNSKSWVASTRLLCGWPRIRALNESNARAAKDVMPMTALSIW